MHGVHEHIQAYTEERSVYWRTTGFSYQLYRVNDFLRMLCLFRPIGAIVPVK